MFFWCLQISQDTKENSTLASKKWSNQKNSSTYYKRVKKIPPISGIKCPYFFLEARAEILKNIVGVLEDLKTPKRHFEINWPLVVCQKVGVTNLLSKELGLVLMKIFHPTMNFQKKKIQSGLKSILKSYSFFFLHIFP